MSDNLKQQLEFESEDLKVLKELWVVEQGVLLEKLVVENTEEWQRVRDLSMVGGMDLSFSKHDQSIAICTLVICDNKQNMKIVYEDSICVRISVPYIPGFLAFREVKPCQYLYKKLVESHPDLVPQVVLFDGNGILHPRGLGLASHFGILENVCTVGVAKNLFQMGSILRDTEHKTQISNLKRSGEFFNLYHEIDQRILGVALKTSECASRPVYVSIGHKIDMNCAVWVVRQCVNEFRIPEPTRQADIRSRREISKCTFEDILELK